MEPGMYDPESYKKDNLLGYQHILNYQLLTSLYYQHLPVKNTKHTHLHTPLPPQKNQIQNKTKP